MGSGICFRWPPKAETLCTGVVAAWVALAAGHTTTVHGRRVAGGGLAGSTNVGHHEEGRRRACAAQRMCDIDHSQVPSRV